MVRRALVAFADGGTVYPKGILFMDWQWRESERERERGGDFIEINRKYDDTCTDKNYNVE